jgi:hypothetical protein
MNGKQIQVSSVFLWKAVHPVPSQLVITSLFLFVEKAGPCTLNMLFCAFLFPEHWRCLQIRFMTNAGMDIKGVAAEIQKDKSTPLVQKVFTFVMCVFDLILLLKLIFLFYLLFNSLCDSITVLLTIVALLR